MSNHLPYNLDCEPRLVPTRDDDGDDEVLRCGSCGEVGDCCSGVAHYKHILRESVADNSARHERRDAVEASLRLEIETLRAELERLRNPSDLEILLRASLVTQTRKAMAMGNVSRPSASDADSNEGDKLPHMGGDRS